MEESGGFVLMFVCLGDDRLQQLLYEFWEHLRRGGVGVGGG